jgi:hypothetical protein
MSCYKISKNSVSIAIENFPAKNLTSKGHIPYQIVFAIVISQFS